MFNWLQNKLAITDLLKEMQKKLEEMEEKFTMTLTTKFAVLMCR
jgi:hypothetical protein